MATESALATLDRVWHSLAPLGHPMAVMGGISLAAWHHVRATRDVDLLIAVDAGTGEARVSLGRGNRSVVKAVRCRGRNERRSYFPEGEDDDADEQANTQGSFARSVRDAGPENRKRSRRKIFCN